MKTPVEQVERELSQIRQLMQHPGWALVCARFDKGLADLTKAILDASTDDETATRLRHARASVLELAPAKLAAVIETKHAAALKKAVEEAQTT